MSKDKPKKLKRAVIKEELVVLTGHYVQALILQQFIYWSERTNDFDQFITEERNRDPDTEIALSNGWVYKTAENLSDELMLGMAPNTMRRHLAKLVEAEYLDQRHNPNHKWDRTLQYRPNMLKIQTDLYHLGYGLEGYPLVIAFSKMENRKSDLENQTFQNGEAIPETTIEITTNTFAEKFSASEISFRTENPPLVSGQEKPNTNGHLQSLNGHTKTEPEPTNEFEDHFGPNPRQDEIDAQKKQPRLSKDELLLQSLGAGVPQPIRSLIGQMRDNRWRVDSEVERGIATFAHVTGYPLPTTKRERNQWETGVRQHLDDEMFRGRMTKLYTAAWEKLKPQVDEGVLTITHPMALTTTMKGIALAKKTTNGEIKAKDILAYLEKKNIIEIKSKGDGSAGYFWVESGQEVESIPQEYIQMVYSV